jgi:hypothetical protein
MKRLPAAFTFAFLFLCLETSATIRLVASFQSGNPSVDLRWNMVNYPGNTAYSLFKSEDGVIWITAAANPVFRNYTASTLLAFRDKFSDEKQLYYKVKVYDENENIIEVSNTEIVNNPVTNYRKPVSNHNIDKALKGSKSPSEEVLVYSHGNSWKIFPNPVRDMLNLVYSGNQRIKGVINLTILDATGKSVIRFRAASNNKQLHVPVSKLHAGIYFIKLNVLNEMQLNEKFIKE